MGVSLPFTFTHLFMSCATKKTLICNDTYPPVTVFLLLQQQRQARTARRSSRSRGIPIPKTKPRMKSGVTALTLSLPAMAEKVVTAEAYVCFVPFYAIK